MAAVLWRVTGDWQHFVTNDAILTCGAIYTWLLVHSTITSTVGLSACLSACLSLRLSVSVTKRGREVGEMAQILIIYSAQLISILIPKI